MSNGRKLFLHNVLTHGDLRREELQRGERELTIYVLTGVEDQDGDTILSSVQQHSQSLNLCRKKQYEQLQNNTMLLEPKATDNYENNLTKVTT